MKTIRRTLRWFLLLLLALAVCGGGYAWWLWERADEMLRRRVLEAFAETVPDWSVSLGRASFDWSRRIHLYDLDVKRKGQADPIASLPEVVVTIDRRKFEQSQQVVVQKIRLVRPVFELVRDEQGRWNWQELLPLPDSQRSCPEIEIQQATVRVRLKQPAGAPPISLQLTGADLSLIPSGKREFLVDGATQVNRAGNLAVDGQWNLDTGRWSLQGRMKGLAGTGEFSELVLDTVPELKTKLTRWESAIARYESVLAESTDSAPRNPFSLASSRQTAGQGERLQNTLALEPRAESSIRRLGVSGTVDVGFHVSQTEPGAEPKFTLQIDVRQGTVTNSLLPFPLHDLEGRIVWDNRQVTVPKLTAKNGITQVTLAGKVVRDGGEAPARFDVEIKNLVLDERLRNRLPGALGEVYDSLQPAGRAEVAGTLFYDGRESWRPHDFVLTFKDCAGTHVAFPYTFHGIEGTLTQRGEVLVVDLKGRAGRESATMTGYIRNPGPEAEAEFDLSVEQLPIDAAFVDACRGEARKTIEALKLEGNLSRVHVHMYRPPGLDRKFQMELTARLRDGALEFVGFPYRLTDLSGDVGHSSEKRLWTFENLKAAHGMAEFTGTGAFDKTEEPGVLDLTVHAVGADFDNSLKHALPASLQEVWNQLSPSGKLDVTTKVRWVPGRPPDVRLPKVSVSDGGLMLRSLPYPLAGVEGSFRYAGRKVDILSFHGRHERTRVRANGQFDWTPEGDWRLHLEEFYADDVVPDRSFRRALPRDLRTIVEDLDPQGPISLSGMAEFRGTENANDPVTAAWDVETIHSGGRLTTGVDLENLYGKAWMRGTWDGRDVNMTGGLDLDSLVVWGYHFTQVRGPFRMNGNQVTVGSREVLLPRQAAESSRPIRPDERITAKAIGGTVSLDAAVVLDRQPSYRVIMTMAEGNLEQYARNYMPRAKNLRGVMTGWIDLQGRGSSADTVTGRGKLQISPAALYELPVMVQIVDVVGPPDKSAFRYGYFDFDVAGRQFVFNRIYLIGDAFSLAGRGTAGFDGRLNLNLYSMLPQSRLPIPIVNVLVGEATTGLIGVKVDGTTGQPRARVTAVPQLEEALERFRKVLTEGPPRLGPQFLIPPLTPQRPVRPRGPVRSRESIRRGAYNRR